jgi:uncharacterized phage protein gp47/JayE
MAIATVIADTSGNYIPKITAGGFLDFATGDWLQLLAEQAYGIDFNPATFTVGNITLTTAASTGPYAFQAGQLIAVFALSGKRYINTSSGIIPAGPDSVVAEFRAEFAGASYVDPSNSGSLTLVSPLPGVSLTNPADDYTAVALSGIGTGTIAPTGTPDGPHQVQIFITSTGAAGVASWSYSIDGAPSVSAGSVSTLSNLGNTGIDVTFTGADVTSFVNADSYLFYSPGSWITTQGSDVESDPLLSQRCRNRWGSLSPIPTNSLYQLLVTSTPDVGGQVTQYIVLPDSVVNDKVNIVVAGPAGLLPPETVATIQEYVTPLVPIGVIPVIVSPSQLNITLGGTITVNSGQAVTAQGAILTELTNYINAVGINGTIRVSAIIDIVMDVAGTVDITGVTINGVAANLAMGSSTSFVVAALEPLTFTYVTVA